MKKILIISESVNEGGAAIAAQRVGNILKKKFDISSSYPLKKDLIGKFKIFITKILLKFFNDNNKSRHSLNIFTRIKLNFNNFDLINIHWIGNETISFDDIKKINKPIVWTMHDMSPFLPIKHYTLDNCDDNSIIKFFSTINFKRKKKLYQNINNFIAVSSWLKMQAENSELLNKINQ